MSGRHRRAGRPGLGAGLSAQAIAVVLSTPGKSVRAGCGRHRLPVGPGLGVGLTAGSIAAVLALLPAATAAPVSAAGPEAPRASFDGAAKAAAHGSASSDRGSEPGPTREIVPASAEQSQLPEVGTLTSPGSSNAASSPLAASGIPTTALDAYTRAAAGEDCGIDWTLIAAIGRVESNHGRFAGAVLHSDGLSNPPVVGIPLTGNGTARIMDTDGGRFDRDPVHDRAVGPMQFIPGTWRAYGADGNGD